MSAYAILCPEPGAGQISHAYLWRNGVKTDLETFPGIDPLNGLSVAWWINSKTQIVGIAATCDFSVFGAFLWEKGSMVDLNTLIPTDSPLRLFLGTYINDRGEITAFGVLPNGDQHAFLLIPCDNSHPNIEGCDYSPAEVSTVAASRAATPQKELTPQEISRIRGLLMNRHRGFMPRTFH
jgi:probable HAF family extracellular repeat protein